MRPIGLLSDPKWCPNKRAYPEKGKCLKGYGQLMKYIPEPGRFLEKVVALAIS